MTGWHTRRSPGLPGTCVFSYFQGRWLPTELEASIPLGHAENLAMEAEGRLPAPEPGGEAEGLAPPQNLVRSLAVWHCKPSPAASLHS